MYSWGLTLCLFLFQGGQTTTQDPAVAFPYNLYKQVSSRGVSSLSLVSGVTGSASQSKPSSSYLCLLVQVQVRLWFIRENLQHIHDLYDHIQRSYAGWNQLKMVEFMQSVERQIQELNSCVSAFIFSSASF